MNPFALPVLAHQVPDVVSTPELDVMLSAGAPVAIGVSGGKDSTAAAFSVVKYLDQIGHSGPRVLIHSDLGVTEWPQSLEWCQKLASWLGLELMVVRRAKGDMMDRWEQRWADNVARYAALKCVRIILPWSTPGMRFCTSEMKTGPICRALSERFLGQTIISVTGIRRQESEGRKNAPITQPQPKLCSIKRDTTGFDWHPIALWSLDDVVALHQQSDFPPHPAYTDWGTGRVSCMNCIMQSDADSRAVAAYPGSHYLHRRIVSLEIASTFAFQGNRWRGDVAPELLSNEMQDGLRRAKERASIREKIEGRIPKHLLYTKGWPKKVPTKSEAEMLAEVRISISALLGFPISYQDGPPIRMRYKELMAQNRARRAA